MIKINAYGMLNKDMYIYFRFKELKENKKKNILCSKCVTYKTSKDKIQEYLKSRYDK